MTKTISGNMLRKWWEEEYKHRNDKVPVALSLAEDYLHAAAWNALARRIKCPKVGRK